MSAPVENRRICLVGYRCGTILQLYQARETVFPDSLEFRLRKCRIESNVREESQSTVELRRRCVQTHGRRVPAAGSIQPDSEKCCLIGYLEARSGGRSFREHCSGKICQTRFAC